MSIPVPTSNLRHLVEPIIYLRDDSECYVELENNTVHVRSISENRKIAVDYTFPLSPGQVLTDGTEFSLYMSLDSLKDCLREQNGEVVSLQFPSETQDSKLVFQFDDRVLRVNPVTPIDQLNHTMSFEQVSNICIEHETFVHALKAANHEGQRLTIGINPRCQRVNFPIDESTNFFPYSVPPKLSGGVQGREASITIPINHLYEIIKSTPDSFPISLSIAQKGFTYERNEKSSGRRLRVHVREILD